MGRKNVHILEWFLTICLLLMAILAPTQYDFGYCLVAFAFTLIGTIVYFHYWGRINANFLDFNPIFIIVALVMGFVFPIIIYSQNPGTAFYFSWGLPYSLAYINKGACISGYGIISFITGSTSKTETFNKVVPSIKYSTNQLIFLLWIVFILLFVILGGFTRYKNIYQGVSSDSNPLLTYLEVFIVAISQVILINECWNIDHIPDYRINKKSLSIIVIVSLIFMYVGNRTICLYLLLPLIIFVATRYIKINLKKFIILILIGGGVMIGSMLFRSGDGINDNLDWYYYLVDLMNPNTTTYLSCEIVDKKGLTYGESMLGAILGIIPFGQSILQNLSGMTQEVTNSATIFTKFLGVQVAGTGTNFISDSYLAFGLLGVFIFSYYPGKIINNLRVNQNRSYLFFLIYMIICGFAVYAVRASFIFMLRFIVYGVLFAYINTNLNVLSKKIRA